MGDLSVGDRVEAMYGGAPTWYPGVIERVLSGKENCTYTIRYDDGDREVAVKRKLIRLVERAPTAERQASEEVEEVSKQSQQVVSAFAAAAAAMQQRTSSREPASSSPSAARQIVTAQVTSEGVSESSQPVEEIAEPCSSPPSASTVLQSVAAEVTAERVSTAKLQTFAAEIGTEGPAKTGSKILAESQQAPSAEMQTNSIVQTAAGEGGGEPPAAAHHEVGTASSERQPRASVADAAAAVLAAAAAEIETESDSASAITKRLRSVADKLEPPSSMHVAAEKSAARSTVSSATSSIAVSRSKVEETAIVDDPKVAAATAVLAAVDSTLPPRRVAKKVVVSDAAVEEASHGMDREVQVFVVPDDLVADVHATRKAFTARKDDNGEVLRVIEWPPEMLTDRLLCRPPFRFLYQIFFQCVTVCGLGEGLFVGEEKLDSKAVRGKARKLRWLSRAVDFVGVTLSQPVGFLSQSKVLAGKEPQSTLRWLRMLAHAAHEVAELRAKDDDAADARNADAVRRVLRGARPPETELVVESGENTHRGVASSHCSAAMAASFTPPAPPDVIPDAASSSVPRSLSEALVLGERCSSSLRKLRVRLCADAFDFEVERVRAEAEKTLERSFGPVLSSELFKTMAGGNDAVRGSLSGHSFYSTPEPPFWGSVHTHALLLRGRVEGAMEAAVRAAIVSEAERESKSKLWTRARTELGQDFTRVRDVALRSKVVSLLASLECLYLLPDGGGDTQTPTSPPRRTNSTTRRRWRRRTGASLPRQEAPSTKSSSTFELGALPSNLLCSLAEGGAFPSLKVLSLDGLSLRSLPGSLYAACPLQRLQGHHSNAGEIREAGEMSSPSESKLRVLSLTGNLLESFPSCLAALTALEELRLRSNRISASSAFPALSGSTHTALRRLDLSHNRLYQVPPELMTLPALEELVLEYNQLRRLPLRLLSAMPPDEERLGIDVSDRHSELWSDGGGKPDELLPLHPLANLVLLALRGNPIVEGSLDERLLFSCGDDARALRLSAAKAGLLLSDDALEDALSAADAGVEVSRSSALPTSALSSLLGARRRVERASRTGSLDLRGCGLVVPEMYALREAEELVVDHEQLSLSVSSTGIHPAPGSAAQCWRGRRELSLSPVLQLAFSLPSLTTLWVHTGRVLHPAPRTSGGGAGGATWYLGSAPEESPFLDPEVYLPNLHRQLAIGLHVVNCTRGGDRKSLKFLVMPRV